jgi:quercetin dioxygenase-like cupin family protein
MRFASLVLILSALEPVASAQSIRVIRFSESIPFQMGKVTSRRIVHPDLGAKNLTLNLSVSQAGAEFSQHVHDQSDDTILVLHGEVDLRQGDTRKPFRTGQCAFVPAGQIHGTITTGPGDNVMISFQAPPDMILYTGARDSSKPGAAPPKGIITPGAVKFVDFAAKDGYFTDPKMGSLRASAAHWRLKRGAKFDTEVASAGEQLLFVWKGAIRIDSDGQTYKVGERDTAFISGKTKLQVQGDSDLETIVIQVQAPAATRL